MHVPNTRKEYIEELSFHLSYMCTVEETELMVDDYEELFENRMSSGEVEAEICLSLGAPKLVAQKYCLEIKKHGNQVMNFIHNPFCVSISLYLLCFIMSFLLMNKCSVNAKNFLLIGMISNAIFAVVFLRLITAGYRSSERGKYIFKRIVMLLFVVSVVLLVVECLLIPSCQNEHVGFYFNLLLALLALFIAGIYFTLSQILLNKNIIYCGTYLLTSFVIHCFYVMNQLHMRSADVSSLRIAMIKGIFYVVESALLFLILIRKAKIKWTHN